MNRTVLNCPFCNHAMTEHSLFSGGYDDCPEVFCCNEDINPKTLTACGCVGLPARWTLKQLAAMRNAN